MHVSEDEFEQWSRRTRAAATTTPAAPPDVKVKPTPSAKGDVERLLAARHERMNKTERDYAAHLQRRLLAGEIAWWGYESFRFRIGDNANYTPDFPVMANDGTLEMHETKGFRFAAGIVRLKAAEELYPMFRWWIVKKVGGEYALVKPAHKGKAKKEKS